MVLLSGLQENVKKIKMIDKSNKWFWPLMFFLISILVTYLTKIWFLFLLIPFGFINFRNKK
jgi:hypothetical protein